MIKARAGDLLIIGLSEINIQRLKERKPIHADLGSLGITGKILIIYGETEEKITEMLQPYIGPETKVEISKRKKN